MAHHSSISPERAARLNAVLERRQPTLSVVFENVHDAHNVSAVMRSCDAVGVLEAHAVYHSGQAFPKLNEKSSASARKWVDVQRHDAVSTCYQTLRDRGFRIYATHISSDAVPLYSLDLTQPVALVFGNEHTGVSEDARVLADGVFVIPQVGIVQSLNISVACAVTLYEAFRQRLVAGMYASSQMADDVLEEKRRDWHSR